MEVKSKDETDSLIQWFLENGGRLNESMEMIHSPDHGYHYVASRIIYAKEIAGICPFSLTLSHLNALPSPPVGIRNCSNESICSKLVGKVNQSTVAAFFLAEQRLKGPDSFWFPYVRLLPNEAEMSTPLWFKDEEFIYLKGTNLLSKDGPREQTSVGRWEGMHREQWEQAIAALKDAGELAGEFTWELFLWAGTIFSSRSFTSNLLLMSNNDSFPLLYPVIDIFNHRFDAKVEWQLDAGNFGLCLTERTEQGQQIFNDYARKGNEELLMGYGFCIPGNPCDQVAFRLGQVPPEIHRKLRERVPSHWCSETWDPQESVFYIRGSFHYTSGYGNQYGIPKLDCLRGIPPELAHSVYAIILASDENAALSEGLEDSKRIWAGTLDALLQQAEAQLLAITRWNSELPDLSSMAGAKAASMYRIGQLKILDEVISELRAFMDPLREGHVGTGEAFQE
ncbi:MAG: hypothetical protein Q9226_008885 [Calogaya cf. arnoldii]